MKRIMALGIGLCAWLPATLAAAQPEQPWLAITGAISERMSHMKAVAAYKYQHGLPLEDLPREAAILSRTLAQAEQRRIDGGASRAFFQTQMDAAKDIQRFWIERWRQGESPPLVEDLNRIIRPRIGAAGDTLMGVLASHAALLWLHRHDAALRQRMAAGLTTPGLTDERRETLLSDLFAITPNRPFTRLDSIVQRGELRVGTTGDYAPFSFRSAPDAPYQGVDIDLAQHLAQSLGVRVRWIETSWPTLMDDLGNDRFDVAMSGISRVLPRQRVGSFSDTYHRGGKSVIGRCDDQGRFASLEDIDRPGVTVIVNPGGTNQRFVGDHVRNARVIVHDDNRTIFSALAAGAAHVMITDLIEVQLQSHRNPDLCPMMAAHTLTYSDKGYLTPRDPLWRDYINLWLERISHDGTLLDALQQHVPGYGSQDWE